MSQDELTVVVETEEIDIVLDDPPDIDLIVKSSPDVIILATGGLGLQGPQGELPPPGGVGAILYTGVGPEVAWSDPLKFKTDENGTLVWGNGIVPDTVLTRFAPGFLLTEGPLATRSGNVYTGFVNPRMYSASPTTYVGLYYDLANNRAVLEALSGGVAFRDILISEYASLLSTKIKLGPVGGPWDAVLYRAAANSLKTDGNFEVGGANFSHSGLLVSSYGRLTIRAGLPEQIQIGDRAGDALTPYILFGLAGDTNLYRSGVGSLKTDGYFTTGQSIYVAPAGVSVIQLGSDGKIYFGALADTNLFRVAANVLRTDGSLQIMQQLSVFATLGLGAASYIYHGSSPGAYPVLYARRAADTNNRFSFSNEGVISWGDGTLGPDTNLYRQTANVLKTDDVFDAAGFQVNGVPFVGGGAVDYIGNWGAGTAYKKGDVVRYNGNDYMAVNDSTGVAPPAPGGSILPARLQAISTQVLDCNTVAENGWANTYAGITANTPGGASAASGLYGILETLTLNSPTQRVQRWHEYTAAKTWQRYGWDGSWTPWVQVLPINKSGQEICSYYSFTQGGGTGITGTGNGDALFNMPAAIFEAGVLYFFECSIAVQDNGGAAVWELRLHDSPTPGTLVQAWVARTPSTNPGGPEFFRVPFYATAGSRTYHVRWRDVTTGRTYTVMNAQQPTYARIVRA